MLEQNSYNRKVNLYLLILMIGIAVQFLVIFTHERHFDDVLDFPRLLLHFGSKKERRRSNRMPRKVGERVEHVETMHIYDRRIRT